MDRIAARSLEMALIADLVENWLHKLEPGPAPPQSEENLRKNRGTAITDSMRGALLHSAEIAGEQISRTISSHPQYGTLLRKTGFCISALIRTPGSL